MSDILIRGMEMPKSCNACIFDVYGLCLINKNIEGKDELTHSCPLVPVPPHGRLIDKDVMCNECRRIAEEYDGIYPDCTYCPAHLAPTIIPAEEGET